MIQKVINSIKQVFIPKSEFEGVETQTSLLSKKAEHFKVKCAVDGEEVPCSELKTTPYTGVPAPDYLPEDPWFPSPILSEKQMSVKEAHEQAVADQQILDESASKESADIHQKLYDMASANWNTVSETQGGSENFHEGSSSPSGWQSGTGYSQFRTV